MKKISIVIVLILTKSLAQNFQIDYLYTNNNGTKKLYTLETNDSISSFVEKEFVNQNEDIIFDKENNYTFYKFKTKKSIYYTDRIFKNILFVQDSIYNFKWSLSDKTKFILGFKCKSATTYFRGRDYIAYYVPDYKINDGPWKFSGLSGIILEVESIDKEYSYRATSIQYLNREINVNEEFLMNVFFNWEQYTVEFKRIMDSVINKLKMQEPENDGGGFFKFNKPEIIYNVIQTGTGLKI